MKIQKYDTKKMRKGMMENYFYIFIYSVNRMYGKKENNFKGKTVWYS